MNNLLAPLTIHNCTNDDIVCRYIQSGQMGRAEVRIGPRGQAMLRDAYSGMVIYASNMFDPSSAFATMQLNQEVDEIHFTDKGGGYGRGPAVGPPAHARDEAYEESRLRTQTRNKEREATAAAATASQTIPGDGADNHGVSLTRAHSADLTKQGGGVAEAGGGEGGGGGGPGDDGRVWVPGLGWMAREAIPPHVMQQLEARQAMQRSHGVQQQRGASPEFPNYDSQQAAARLDGTKLPPVRLKSAKKTALFGDLTLPERFVAGKMHQYMRMSPTKCESCARPVCLLLLGVAAFIAVKMYTRRKSAERVRRFGRY